jgi:hypothetical protein
MIEVCMSTATSIVSRARLSRGGGREQGYLKVHRSQNVICFGFAHPLVIYEQRAGIRAGHDVGNPELLVDFVRYFRVFGGAIVGNTETVFQLSACLADLMLCSRTSGR